jgi:hypothetical protein
MFRHIIWTCAAIGSGVIALMASPDYAGAASANRESTFQISGIIVGPDANYAIVKHLTVNKTKLLQRGEEIDGWTVEEIASEHVLLRHGNERIRLGLSTQRGAAKSDGNANGTPNQPVRASPQKLVTSPRPSPSLARQQERAALRARLNTERNERRAHRQQRLAACRLQARQQGLRREPLRVFVRSCSGR